ncbi:uncharacterized protein TNCV_3643851 [Trichonephila clavipes]|nr:uncharacterized protein TNCV_3643851 [Trichonephila clavipes]
MLEKVIENWTSRLDYIRASRGSPMPEIIFKMEKYGTAKTVTGSAYLDALLLWLFPQLEESEPTNFIWQQEGAPPHWYLSVRDWLNITVPNQWIGRKERPDKACIAWPPRSPDLTSCDFYLRGFKKRLCVRSYANS